MNNLIVNFKRIHDPIYGIINISNYAYKIINTRYFHRLLFIKQLGAAIHVFPSASHTRYEHCIGTYHLAGVFLEKFRDTYIPELSCNLNTNIIELVKLAGLLHDIGHGPYSHMFDNLCDVKTVHETRSKNILELMIKNDIFLQISSEYIDFMKDLIDPNDDNTGFIYQFISNKLNGIDVDKLDYMVRDSYHLNLEYSVNTQRILQNMSIINNNICYSEKIYHDIMFIFITRYRLYKQIYCHHVVVAIEYMLSDIIKILNTYDILNLNEYMKYDKFHELTDNFIVYLSNKNKKTLELYNRIIERKLYKKINETCDNNDIIHHNRIGFINNNSVIYFYDENNKICDLNIDKSLLYPNKNQETNISIYSRKL